MQWIETEVTIKELKDYEKNPRKISKEQLSKLVKSIKEDGYRTRIVVDHDNTIIGGHARKRGLKLAGFKDNDEIKVLKPERPLTKEEFERINIRDNGHFGDWDMDGLANMGYDMKEFIDWGVPSNLFTDMLQGRQEEVVKQELSPTYKLELEFLNKDTRDKAYNEIIDLGYQVNIK